MRIVSFVKHVFRNHRWKVIIAALVLLPIGAVTMFALKPAQPEYVTDVVKRGELLQTVEAVGTITSERDLQLQFPTSGIVAQVYVKEGDKVNAGQRLAQLRAGNLSADIASASARLQSAQAELRAKEEGARPEDIAITEAEVENRRSSLEAAKSTLETSEESLRRSQEKLTALKQEAIVSLIGYVSNASSDATLQLTTAQNSIGTLRDVLNNNDLTDAIIKYGSAEYDLLNASILAAEKAINDIYASGVNPADYEEALVLLERSRAAVSATWNAANRGFNLVSTIPTTSYFDDAAREGYKNTLAAERSSLQSALGALDNAIKTLRDASANFATRITAEEAAVASAEGTKNKALADIATFESSLRIAEAQLQLKRAPTRKADLDAARANVQQARAALARAQADYGNTVLTAPIAGVVTKVNVKTGEFTPAGAALTMLGDSPYRIEMFVSEIDIPKVRLTQTGSIELDAFRGTNYALRVSEIDTASTDRDGVSKYRVRLDFVYPHDEFKIGMTGDAEIITGERQDVLSVPQRAVIEGDEGPIVRILNQDGTVEEKPVETGMEGSDGNVEVTGVEEGETIIVLIRE